jgi:hypothetical protein
MKRSRLAVNPKDGGGWNELGKGREQEEKGQQGFKMTENARFFVSRADIAAAM